MHRSSLPKLAAALALALAAGLSHAAGDAGSCRYVPVAKLPLHFSRAGQPLVDGSIDGKPATLVVDTGAYKTFLTRTAIDRLAIPVKASARLEYGAGGASKTFTASLDEFSIGPVHSGRITLPVIAESARFPFDAIYGDDSMRALDLEISLADKFIQFYKAGGCAGTFLAYWDKDAMEIPLAARPRWDAHRPFLPVELNGIKFEALLDSGVAHTFVRRRVAERFGIKPGSPDAPRVGLGSGVGDGKVVQWRAGFDTFTIGSETIKNIRLDITDDSPGGDEGKPDIVLGDDFLRAHRVLIAPSQQKLYVSYVGGDVFSR